MKAILATACLALLPIACGDGGDNGDNGDKEISVSDYERSCEAASDCVAVKEGECHQCGDPCDYGAIAKTDETQYLKDLDDLGCEADDSIECSSCPAVPAVDCVESTCVIP